MWRVAHLGWCSHQAALGFLFINFLKLFPPVDRALPYFHSLLPGLHSHLLALPHSQGSTCDDFCRVYPPNVFMVQRDGCPWAYAVDRATREQVKSFGRLKWTTKTPPDSNKRDTVQLLVSQVKGWKERWEKVASAPAQKHAFAREQVDCVVE